MAIETDVVNVPVSEAIIADNATIAVDPLQVALDLAWQVIDAVGGLAEMKAGYTYTKAIEARKATVGS